MHLSFTEIELYRGYENNRFNLGDIKDIDSLFFHSVPSSRFILDERIPEYIGELLTEADGSLKMNFLTGAGACLRRAIQELTVVLKAEGENYLEKIEFLKENNPHIDSIHFEILARIDEMAGKVHDQPWDKWELKYLKLIIETLRALLNELFILPSIKKDKKKEIEALLEDIKKDENELVDINLEVSKKQAAPK